MGGAARSTIRWWLADRTRAGRPSLVGTAHVVDRDGTVFEAFQPEAWAYQFGLTWPAARRLAFERRFIGIELASEGPLIERDGARFAIPRYVAELRRPRITLGRSIGLIAAAGAGFLLAGAIHE